jgi:hypothetical protein
MKNFIIILIIVIGVILFIFMQMSKQDVKEVTNPAEPQGGLKCSIRPLEGPFKRGDIKFIFTLQNVSDEVIHLPKTKIKGESGLWIAMTGEKGEKFAKMTFYFPFFVGTDRTDITEIPPRDKFEFPLSYGGYFSGKPTRFWCGLVVNPDMVPETYDGWTGSITSNVIEVNTIE